MIIRYNPYVTTHYEIWCTNPVQCIDRLKTAEEAEKAFIDYISGGILTDDYTNQSYDPKNFILIIPGECLDDYKFFADEEKRIKGWCIANGVY